MDREYEKVELTAGSMLELARKFRDEEECRAALDHIHYVIHSKAREGKFSATFIFGRGLPLSTRPYVEERLINGGFVLISCGTPQMDVVWSATGESLGPTAHSSSDI